MAKERINYEVRGVPIPEDCVRVVPSSLKCRTCGAVILKSKKDPKRKHMSVDIVTRKPPEIMQDGAVMRLRCDRCGSSTLLQLRSQ